jgi:SAM-dependent methyltransferase
MPIGSHSIVSHVARELEAARPHRVLDLGIGFGFYGAVVRQWLDRGVRPWMTYLEGIEGWGRYSNPLWDVYNLVRVCPIQEYLQAPPREPFDFVLLNDVLEHFAPDEGREVIRRIRAIVRPGGRLVVGTPARYFDQGAVHGNDFERHRSSWSAGDFREMAFEVLLDGSEAQLGFPMILARWCNRPVDSNASP